MIDNFDTVIDEFTSLVEQAQTQLLSVFLKLILALEITNNRLAFDNYTRVDALMNDFRQKALSGKYREALRYLNSEMDKQFKSVIDKFGRTKFDTVQLTTLATGFTQMKQRALASLTTLDGSLFNPVSNALTTAIVTGTTVGQLSQTADELITGGTKRKGSMRNSVVSQADSYYTGVSRATLTRASFLLGYTKFRYSGGIIKDSRDFCIKRNGNVYTEDEIRTWAGEDWEGKDESTNETNIFVLLGGHRCRHFLEPVIQASK